MKWAKLLNWQWLFPRDYLQPNVAAAMVGAAVVGGAISSDASRSASNTQADAAKQAADLQAQQLEKTRQSLQPFVDSGYGANKQLLSALGIGPNNGTPEFGSLTKPFDANTFNQFKDPGYQFRLQQGQQALQNSQAAQNGVLSGSALKELMNYNQDMASTEYNNAFARYMGQNEATYGRLAGLLGIGENAAAGVGNVGAQTSANIGSALMGAGSAQAAGKVGQANALSGALNTGAGYYALNNMSGGSLFGTGSSGFVPNAAGTTGAMTTDYGFWE